MGPERPLPYSADFSTPEQYVDSLLQMLNTNTLLKTLTRSVHILDFFTSDPDLYGSIIPEEWQTFFREQDIMNILDLLMREDLDQFTGSDATWREGPAPPQTLLEYIRLVRQHLLIRTPPGTQCSRNRAMKPTQKLARHVSVGMNVKKIHEVGLFANYLDGLATEISETTGNEVSHLVDFGSGQNYLGRALASAPYNRRIVAIESKSSNADRAREYDVTAKLSKKKVVIRNKKAFRAGLESPSTDTTATPPPEPVDDAETQPAQPETTLNSVELPVEGKGSVQYVDHRIKDGDLSEVISDIPDIGQDKNLLVMSLHSCGNLVHHGLRSLVVNPEVRSVAMVGCCYNLLTSRLGRTTYKHPFLRPTPNGVSEKNARSEQCDPHGFPMSSRLCNYRVDATNVQSADDDTDAGVNLDITARMMAVQAPQNWGAKDSDGFFTRHFYRALLQRIFLDRGIVGRPSSEGIGGSPLGHSSGGTPIVIGSLRKSCYADFVSYVRGALLKLCDDSEQGQMFTSKTADLTDEEILDYETRFAERKKDLSVIWSLMAFSAGVVEATIVVDRWLWMQEQEQIKQAWVESVFDYSWSPRNLVVVGVKE